MTVHFQLTGFLRVNALPLSVVLCLPHVHTGKGKGGVESGTSPFDVA